MSTQNLNVTSGAPISISGLASGLDTTSIVSELMSINRQPVNSLTIQQQRLQAQEANLQAIQGKLQGLSTDAKALSSPTLFSKSQAVSSSDPTRVAASSSTGAGVGGYQVSVSQLANSAQRTFSFTSPSADDTITIDGHQTSLAAGASAQDFVSAINSDANATVYAAATDSGTVVLSNRNTGDTGTGFIAMSDAGGALTEQAAKAKQGQNALFSVDGVSGTSSSNKVTNAIAGVSLTLTGVTTTSGPITVNVSPPAPNTTNIENAINKFITDYNSTVDAISGQLTQTPISTPANQSQASVGTLYGDQGLSSLLTRMRQSMYTSAAGLPSGLASLADLGITTGAPSGGTVPSASTLAGHLTLDPTKLEAQLASNPSGVANLLKSFVTGLTTQVDTDAQPGGTIDQRVSSETSQISFMGTQISNMNATLAEQQQALTTKFANLEAALSRSQSQGSELANEIAQL